MASANQQRRQRLLDVATALFMAKGFDNTSLDQVVAQAGGSKQTVYRYFGSKQGLFYAVIEHVTDQVIGVYSLEQASVEDYAEVLRAFAENYMSFVLGDQGRDLARAVISHSLVSNDVAEKFLELGPDRYVRLASYFDRLVEAGKLQMDDTTLAATQWLGALRGDYHVRRLVDARYQCTSEQIKEAADAATEMFIRAYSCR
jgi:AcrR family transcriptional regulator